MTIRGLVLGKFLPPHLGHLHLVDFAQACVDELAVVVGSLQAEPIGGGVRCGWMRELAPHARVIHLTDENPQQPEEHADFWGIWERSLRRVLPWEPTTVFASEPYGARLAEIWGAEFVMVDEARRVVPVSGTAIRERPLLHWQYLPRCVRPWFAKRVSVFGPESTGKTTLCEQLAAHYRTVWVPEYARTHLESRAGAVAPEDMPTIARRQRASEEALARHANRLLVSDTDPLLTCAWSQALFAKTDDVVARLGAASRYHLTLLTDIDVPFEPDPVRYLPTQRAPFMRRCEALLAQHGRAFVRLSGGAEERLQAAVAHIDALLLEGDELGSG